MSIQELIDQALAKKEDRIRSSKFSPSSFGRCFRYQFWNRKNEPISNPIKPRVERVFKAGNLFHDFVQGVILKENPNAQKEVPIEIDDVKGYADLVLEDEVIDLKSQHSKAFWYRSKLEWKDVEIKIYNNILQVMFYAIELKKLKARLVYISKDDLCIQEYSLTVNDKWKEEIEKELLVLRNFWTKNELPPAVPRAYLNNQGESVECGYCGFKDTCGLFSKFFYF